MFLIFFEKKDKKIIFPLFNREGCLILMPVRSQARPAGRSQRATFRRIPGVRACWGR
jgi:hypothetical protein